MLAYVYLFLSILLVLNTFGLVAPRHYGPTLGFLGAIPFLVLMMLAPHIIIFGLVLTIVVALHGVLGTWAGQCGLVLHIVGWGVLFKHFLNLRSTYPLLDGRPIEDTAPIFESAAQSQSLPAAISLWPYLRRRTLAMASVVVKRSILYRQIGGVRLYLDVYSPRVSPTALENATAGRKPPFSSIVYIHGGAWVIGTRRQSPFMMYELAAAGHVVFAIQYRLAPRHPLPAAIEDCKAAVAWVREHAAAYGGTADAVVIGGSAGAYLAAMVALSPNEKRFQPNFEAANTSVRGAVLLYGIYDIVDRLKPAAPRLRFVPSDWFFESVVYSARYQERPEIFHATDPFAYVSKAAPPTLFIHGLNDTIVPAASSRMLHQRLLQAGTTSYLCEVPRAQHAFEIVPSPLHQRTLRIILRFVDAALPPSRD